MLDSRETRRRLGINKLLGFRIVVFVLFGILAVQLAHLQIVKGSSYETRATQNSVAIIELPAERGIITDRSGVQLVDNVPAYDAVAVPGRISDSERREIIFQLADILAVPEERLSRLIEEGEDEALFAPVVLKGNLTREEALMLRALEPEMRGITLEVAASRQYDSGELLAPIVGYIGPISPEEYDESQEEDDDPYDLGDRLGRTGIEAVYEEWLRGEDGARLIEQDALGRQLRLLREEDPVPGDRVVLSLDYTLQNATAAALQQSMETFDAPIGAAVVLDVRTGEVLSLVSLPSYDANAFADGVSERTLEQLNDDIDGRPLVNHAISDAFPPGSIFKVITAAAALELGDATPETTYSSPGYLEVRNESGVLEDESQRFNDTQAGTFDLRDGLAASSNVYFYCLVANGLPGSQFFFPGCGPDEVEGVGPADLARMSADFGLGGRTGIDLPGETSGTIPPDVADDPDNPDDDTGNADLADGPFTALSAWFGEISGFDPPEPWRLGNTLQFAIGQNVVTTSPVQMAVVATALANGGRLLEPRLVHDIIGPDGLSIGSAELDDRRIVFGQPSVSGNLAIDQATLQAIREGMLLATTAEYGTATPASIAGVQIAGKTGSPQIDETNLATGKLTTHAWFIGFGPFEEAEIAVAVYVQGGTGAEAAAPVARAIFEAWFNSVNVRAP